MKKIPLTLYSIVITLAIFSGFYLLNGCQKDEFTDIPEDSTIEIDLTDYQSFANEYTALVDSGVNSELIDNTFTAIHAILTPEEIAILDNINIEQVASSLMNQFTVSDTEMAKIRNGDDIVFQQVLSRFQNYHSIFYNAEVIQIVTKLNSSNEISQIFPKVIIDGIKTKINPYPIIHNTNASSKAELKSLALCYQKCNLARSRARTDLIEKLAKWGAGLAAGTYTIGQVAGWTGYGAIVAIGGAIFGGGILIWYETRRLREIEEAYAICIAECEELHNGGRGG